MKRIMSFLLCLCMVLSLVPLTARAATVVDSGSCGADGSNVTWSLDSNGILTISGSGKMADYGGQSATKAPWNSYNSQIASVVVKSGVTYIGKYAFDSCGLSSITLPDSVTEFGVGVFEETYNLKTVKIPSSVTLLPDWMFYDSNIESVELPDGLETIDWYVFYKCRNLKSLVIPDNVTLGKYAFKESRIEYLTLGSNAYINANCFYDATIVNFAIPYDGYSYAGDNQFNSSYSTVKNVFYPGTQTNFKSSQWNRYPANGFSKSNIHYECEFGSFEHTYGEATCTTPATCIYCPVTKGTATGHHLTKVEATSATCTTTGNHAYYTCSGCTDIFEDSEGNVVTTLDKVTIAVDKSNHTGTLGDWQHDGTNHWKEYSCCGAHAEETAHNDDNHNHACDTCGATVSDCADTDKNHECDICGETMGEHVCDQDVVTEKYLKSAANCQSAAVYYKSCSYCGAASETDTFTHGEVDSENHTGTLGDWQHDADKHWKEYSCCGAHVEETAHNDDNHNHACDTCGATVSECADTNNDHHCDVCDKEMTQCVDSDKNHECDICGATMGEHKAAEGSHICDYCGKAASECVDENKDHKCDVCNAAMGEHKAAEGSHDCAYCGKPVTECADNDNDHLCDVCGKELSKCTDDDHDGKCDICGEILSTVIRLGGEDRRQTALKIADELKEVLGVEKFDTIIVTNGGESADALSGSYLAAAKSAPVLLSSTKTKMNAEVIAYIKANLAENGTIYILGGDDAVPTLYEDELSNFKIQRLAGDTRYETNQLILKEVGVPEGSEILVCTGKGYADSLSASATGKPILLVQTYKSGKIAGVDAKFLSSLKNCTFTIVGGDSAVDEKIEAELKKYGEVTRIQGETRYETSIEVANRYFEEPTSVVLAYGHDFPDGLCGGVLAYVQNAPLVLTRAKDINTATAYAEANGITSGYVLGHSDVISDETVRTILGLSADFEVIAK